MSWWEILVVVAVGLLVFKFLVKPLLKFFALAALIVVTWLLLMN